MIGTGTTLAHYRVLEQLGAGGMGIVYRAHDGRLDRDVALKVLSAASGDESVRLAITREAHALARLTHPHIGAVYELGRADGIDFIYEGLNSRSRTPTSARVGAADGT